MRSAGPAGGCCGRPSQQSSLESLVVSSDHPKEAAAMTAVAAKSGSRDREREAATRVVCVLEGQSHAIIEVMMFYNC